MKNEFTKFETKSKKIIFLMSVFESKTENIRGGKWTKFITRPVGAHYWLSKTNYNYGIITEVGGWYTIDELKKSYEQIPPEKILKIIIF